MPKTHNTWTEEMDALLIELYPAAKWSEIHAALPGITRTAMYQRARKLGLSRWNQGNGEMGEIVAGRASEADIGWLAGFIDGEGTLQLGKRPRMDLGRMYLSPSIRVVNNDRAAAEKCHRLMGGFLSQSKTRPEQWSVLLTSIAKVERILVVLLPHLTVKAERARLLLEYAEVRRGKPGRAPYGDEEQAIYDAFYFGSGRASAIRPSRVKVGDYANAELNPEETLVNV